MIFDCKKNKEIDNFVCIGDNSIRKEKINKIESYFWKLTKLIHQKA